MDEPIVTFGLWMGLEVESQPDRAAGGAVKSAVLVFCPAGESEQGKIDETSRMKDLALMGFKPVAIIRGNPEDTLDYVILAKENLSAKLKTAVLEEAARIVRNTSEGFELQGSCTDNNQPGLKGIRTL